MLTRRLVPVLFLAWMAQWRAVLPWILSVMARLEPRVMSSRTGSMLVVRYPAHMIGVIPLLS